MNSNSALTNELKDKGYRKAYVASQIRIGMPFQIRGLRKSLGLNQADFAALVGMTQPRVSELEKPGARNLSIDTLLRVAAGADVALQVHFVPFSELMDWSEGFDPDNFNVPTFEQEIQDLEERKANAEIFRKPANLEKSLVQRFKAAPPPAAGLKLGGLVLATPDPYEDQAVGSTSKPTLAEVFDVGVYREQTIGTNSREEVTANVG